MHKRNIIWLMLACITNTHVITLTAKNNPFEQENKNLKTLVAKLSQENDRLIAEIDRLPKKTSLVSIIARSCLAISFTHLALQSLITSCNYLVLHPGNWHLWLKEFPTPDSADMAASLHMHEMFLFSFIQRYYPYSNDHNLLNEQDFKQATENALQNFKNDIVHEKNMLQITQKLYSYIKKVPLATKFFRVDQLLLQPSFFIDAYNKLAFVESIAEQTEPLFYQIYQALFDPIAQSEQTNISDVAHEHAIA
jgi:hypothetical protein